MHCLLAGIMSTYLEVEVGRTAIESARKNCVKSSHAGTVGESHTPQEGQIICSTCTPGGGRSTACKVMFDVQALDKFWIQERIAAQCTNRH